jgi:hypothetical protein
MSFPSYFSSAAARRREVILAAARPSIAIPPATLSSTPVFADPACAELATAFADRSRYYMIPDMSWNADAL